MGRHVVVAPRMMTRITPIDTKFLRTPSRTREVRSFDRWGLLEPPLSKRGSLISSENSGWSIPMALRMNAAAAAILVTNPCYGCSLCHTTFLRKNPHKLATILEGSTIPPELFDWMASNHTINSSEPSLSDSSALQPAESPLDRCQK